MAALVVDTGTTTGTCFTLYSPSGSCYDTSNNVTTGSYIPSNLSNVFSRYIGEANNSYTRYRMAAHLNYLLQQNQGTATNYDSSTYIDNCFFNESNATGNIIFRDSTVVTSGGFVYAFVTAEELKKEQFRKKIQNQLILVPKGKADPVINPERNEALAIETLREMITEEEFKRFIARGFITVQGRSGKTYQIFRNNWHTKVWVGGKLVEEICVRISGKVKAPATDNLIAFKAMIEADEEEFRKIGNVYKFNRAA